MAIKDLLTRITVTTARATGIVEVQVVSPWRSVSLAIASALADGVNDYNQRTRQGQAAAERRFIESRLEEAKSDLGEVEDRLSVHIAANRRIDASPELTFERDRLQRELALKQGVYESLAQAYEDARIREVRDTPVLTMVEPPSAPTTPLSRGRLKRLILGMVLGGFVAVFTVIASMFVNRLHNRGGTEVEEFLGTLHEAKDGLLRPAAWLRRRPRV